MFEGFLLIIILLLIGLFLGWLLCNRFIVYVNLVNYYIDVLEVVFIYGIFVFLLVVLFIIVIVWIFVFILV